MLHPAYRWVAWFGLWLLIAANARAADVSAAPVASAAGNLSAPIIGAISMALVIGLWIVIAHALARGRAQRRFDTSLARVWIPRPERKRPPHP